MESVSAEARAGRADLPSEPGHTRPDEVVPVR